MNFKKFSEIAQVPTKVTPGSACFDVYSSCEVRLRPGETKRIPLNMGFKFSKKLCCRIYLRSGLSLLPTFIGGGVVDSDYRGNLSVILTNFSLSDVEVNAGDKIAQNLIMPILQNDIDFDFTNLAAEEKKLIIKLLNKQEKIANFLIQNNPADYILRTYLTFITLICSSTFGDFIILFQIKFLGKTNLLYYVLLN